MTALAALLTFALTALFSMAGVGAALIPIPVFLAFGIDLHTAMATALSPGEDRGHAHPVL